MFETNALTDAIGLTIAVSYALQPAIGPGVTGVAGILALENRAAPLRWLPLALGTLFGGMLGVVAWRGDGDPRWTVIGLLAGLLAGAGDARLRSRSARIAFDDDAACRCQSHAHRWDT